MSDPLESKCILECLLNEAKDECVSCGRTLQEIKDEGIRDKIRKNASNMTRDGRLRVVFRESCGYHLVPQHPTMAELLRYLIDDAAKFAEIKRQQMESDQRRSLRIQATVKRIKRKKNA
jgi:predicted Fe-S protein YdhL (DUF1289 family)|tara:strand:+ start:84 stop:440 length:357 start_codon:yes stop_codon:yes gene_type:complete